MQHILLKQILGHKCVLVFVLTAATEWIKNWKSNGWKSTRGEDVKNKEDILRLDNLCSKINVKWVSIPYVYIDSQ